MKAFIYLMILTMFAYTVGVALSQWKENNKVGSVVIFGFALIIAIAPFFTLLK